MLNPGFDDFVSAEETPIRANPGERRTIGHLLWGDGVRRLNGAASGGWVKVTARGRTGWVKQEHLGGSSLLELYFIDVGQGDGILIKTPDFRHIVIDGGHPRDKQITGKSGADFVDWKFFEDYGQDVIALDWLIASHNDYDHYGGLIDLFELEELNELDTSRLTVESIGHAGLSWWKLDDGRWLGESTQDGNGDRHFIQLLTDRGSADAAVTPAAGAPQLQGTWQEFISRALGARREDGSPTPFVRLGNSTGMLPGFAAGDVTIRVLGPIDGIVGGRPSLPAFDDGGKSTNGNSVLLRLDYDKSRILLTGDLNTQSQKLILDAVGAADLECDVAKACHHGSEDVSIAFLQAMHAGATVISSGDGEGHDHPRPRIVAASGLTGFKKIVRDKLVTPLVYSTELARSVTMADPFELDIDVPGDDPLDLDAADLKYAQVKARERLVFGSRTHRKTLAQAKIVGRLIYGLVNVRTDGRTILCATMNEGDGGWSIKTFKARF
jgi:beta-lactamase superfamily II metal-dependent hydrolase